MSQMLQLPENILRILFEKAEAGLEAESASHKTIQGLFKTLKRHNRGVELKDDDFISTIRKSNVEHLRAAKKERKKIANALLKVYNGTDVEFLERNICPKEKGYGPTYSKVKVIGPTQTKLGGQKIEGFVRVQNVEGRKFDAFASSLILADTEGFLQHEDGWYYQEANKQK